MFAKVFTQILDSSLAEDYQTRHVFEDLLKLCDINGVVDMTHEAIARRTNVPLEIVSHGIAQLEKPDVRSRNPDFEGRRIVPLDDHRDWGWKIVNYSKYREIRTHAERTAALGYDSSRRGYIYYAVDDPDQPMEVKIGFSINPWARMIEMRAARPKIKILATEHGTLQEESAYHEKFQQYLVSGEWFRFEGELKAHVELLGKGTTTDRSSRRRATSPTKTYAPTTVTSSDDTRRSGSRTTIPTPNPNNSSIRSTDRSDEADRSSMQRQRQRHFLEEREIALSEIPPMGRKDFDAMAQMRGVPKDCAEWFWNTHDARDWMDATGQPIIKVEPLLLNTLAKWRSRSKSPPSQPQSSASSLPTAELIVRQKEYERVIEEIARLKRNAAMDAIGTPYYTVKEKSMLQELRTRRDELKKLLDIKI